MDSKKVQIFAGPNGVGKTTLGEETSSSTNIQFINPDAIKRQQEILHNAEINNVQLNYVLDTYITNALETEDEILFESNLHSQDAYHFISSYIDYFKAESICYFYYVDSVELLIKRVQERVNHLGHNVPVETIKLRYRESFRLIIENINRFDEVHFFDNSQLEVSDKIIEFVNGELNYVNDSISFPWSDKLLNKFILKFKKD